jgi:curli production assembly/transport component CsgG
MDSFSILILKPKAFILSFCFLVTLGGCTEPDLQSIGTHFDKDAIPPLSTPTTSTGLALRQLPAPQKKIDVAIYKYEDKTGQNEESDDLTRFSRAVSQGMSDILIDVLTEVGDGQWFNVVDRSNIQDLLFERQLIDQTNLNYRGLRRSALQPLRFAGVIISGGVVDYDTNVVTGGAGARLLGVGNNFEYRQDRISVVLRAVSVQTGDVLASVQTEKTIYSLSDQLSIFRYVAVDRLLELDAGYSVNEPTGIAVRQALELAVYDLILEGAEDNIWQFIDIAVQRRLVARQKTRLALFNAPAIVPQPHITEPLLQPTPASLQRQAGS